MNEKIKKVIEAMSKSEKITGEDIMFAFNVGYRQGRIEVLEEQLGGVK
jgi:ribulose 1,5-bisphosphate carboxylase large subunit-like protein